jgi:hypothetical protein
VSRKEQYSATVKCNHNIKGSEVVVRKGFSGATISNPLYIFLFLTFLAFFLISSFLFYLSRLSFSICPLFLKRYSIYLWFSLCSHMFCIFLLPASSCLFKIACYIGAGFAALEQLDQLPSRSPCSIRRGGAVITGVVHLWFVGE